MSWLWLSAGLMIFTAVVHSWLGEVRLIGPLVSGQEGVMQSQFSRRIVRYAWHVTSVLAVATALTVAWSGVPPRLVTFIGAIWVGMGMTSLIVTRGKHVGWPVFMGAGAAALIGAAG